MSCQTEAPYTYREAIGEAVDRPISDRRALRADCVNQSVTIAYACPNCGAPQAILPPRADAATAVRCAGCGQEHGPLREIRQALSEQAREDAIRKARHIYQSRPQRRKTRVPSQGSEGSDG